MNLLRALFISMVLLVPGCDAATSADAAACWADNECTAGRICAFNYCISDAENSLMIAAKIVPAPSSGYVIQQIPAMDLNTGHAADVTLVEAVEISGTITLKDHPFAGYNVPGVLEARAPGDIDGHDYRFTTHSLEGLNEDGQGYLLRVLPGRDYDLRFRPDDRAIPLYSWVLRAPDGKTMTHDVVLPADEYVPVAGFVRFAPLEVVGEALVTAMLPDGTAVTSTTTDELKGHFELDLPPETTHVRFKIKGSEDGVLFPEFVSEEFVVGLDLAIWVPKPEEPPVIVSLRLVALGPDDGLLGVPETTVTVATTDGKLRQSVTTDENGVATFETLPGEHQVAVCPSPGSAHASYAGNVQLEAGNLSPEIKLGQRIAFHGRVLTDGGVGVESGSIVLMRILGDGDAKGALVTPAPFTGSLEPDGSFALLVDPGRYGIRVSPHPGTGAPPLTITNVDIPWKGEMNIVLPPPDLLHIRVLNPLGEAVSDVAIEVYVVPADGDAPELLTIGTSGDAGVVDILVPLID